MHNAHFRPQAWRNWMYPELRDSESCNNPSGIFSVPKAEHTMGLLLALARNFPLGAGQTGQTGAAAKLGQAAHLSELNERFFASLDTDRSGGKLRSGAKAFEMKVWGVTRSGAGEPAHVEKLFRQHNYTKRCLLLIMY